MKSIISLILAVGISVAGFAESRKADKALHEDFTRKLEQVEMCLEVEDGELCLRIYHEMWKKGYRLKEDDKANVEQAFTICKKDYKIRLAQAIRDPRFDGVTLRKQWTETMALYNDLTSKQRGDAGKVPGAKPIVRLSVAYMAIGESDIQKIGNSQSATGDDALQRRGVVFDVLRDLVCGSNNCNTACVETTLDITRRSISQAGITRMSETGSALIENGSKKGVKFRSGGTLYFKVGDDPANLQEIDYGITISANGAMVDDAVMSLDFDCDIRTIIPGEDGDFSWKDDRSQQKITCSIGQTTLVSGFSDMVGKDAPPSAFPFFRSNPLLKWFLTDCGKAVSDRRLVIMICPEIVDGKQNVTPDDNKVINIPVPEPNERDGGHECEACKKRGGFWSWLDWFMF